VLVVVEVTRGLVLVAVLGPVAVGVGLAAVEPQAVLERVGQQVVVVVGVDAVGLAVAVAVGVRVGLLGLRRRRRLLGADDRGPRAAREALAEARREDADLKRGRDRRAVLDEQDLLEPLRELDPQQLRGALLSRHEDGLRPPALEGNGVLVHAAAEVLAVDRQRLADEHPLRGDPLDDWRLGLGICCGRARDGGHQECGQRGHQAGATQHWAGAGSVFHRPRYRRTPPRA
jgi:hypothetical protein